MDPTYRTRLQALEAERIAPPPRRTSRYPVGPTYWLRLEQERHRRELAEACGMKTRKATTKAKEEPR
ncbi:hypothetical protein [Marinactinospora rubrisoli]|uniref:Transcriptional regulator n=1 Tax=Marinactinospora rubrisoli TaxID=2715399 RepID=A0ABW2KLF7_9ACTN